MHPASKFVLVLTLCGLCFPAASAGAADKCGSKEHHEFDFWVGEWSGVEKSPEAGADKPMSTAKIAVTKVLGGCALLEHKEVRASDLAFDSATLMAYDKPTGTWALHYYDDFNFDFQVWDGSQVDGRWRFSRERLLDGKKVQVRITWTVVSHDKVTWKIERSMDGGATWTPRSVIEYVRSH